jgi:hypothetical protein
VAGKGGWRSWCGEGGLGRGCVGVVGRRGRGVGRVGLLMFLLQWGMVGLLGLGLELLVRFEAAREAEVLWELVVG